MPWEPKYLNEHHRHQNFMIKIMEYMPTTFVYHDPNKGYMKAGRTKRPITIIDSMLGVAVGYGGMHSLMSNELAFLIAQVKSIAYLFKPECQEDMGNLLLKIEELETNGQSIGNMMNFLTWLKEYCYQIQIKIQG